MRKRVVFGLTAAGLAALMIAAPADSQTAKKTAVCLRILDRPEELKDAEINED
jgi:hypothetical protein